MSIDSGGFRFVSHQRRGLIALAGVAGSGTIEASAVLSDGSSTTPVTLDLPGAGDVLGLDATLVARRYPQPGTTDAEAEFFPLVEFSVPEVPWLVPTPPGPHGVVPWLCLVAVELRNGVSLKPGGLGTLAVLQIGNPARPAEELPDPADAALWAHAFAATQAHTDPGSDPVEVVAGPPLAGSRLVAPRRLEANTTYTACVVPTLAAAALAGLGHADSEVAAALAAPQPNYAWSPTDASVELPVYLSWEFSCVETGDFESLARALREVPVDDTFGTQQLDLGLAGPGMPVTTTTAMVLRGALTAPGVADEPAWPDTADADQKAVDTALVAEIEAAAALNARAGEHGRPAIGPLLYAQAASGRKDVGAAEPAADWFDQLNRDPRARAVAGLGTRVLRRNAEDVMAAAWEQVGDVEAANAALRRLQVSRAVSASMLERHLSAVTAGRLLPLARPLLARVALPPDTTGGTTSPNALATVAASALPAGSTWRGVGPMLRRLGGAADGDTHGRVVAGLTAGIAEPDILPDGTISAAPPSAVFGAAAPSLVDDQLRTAATAAGLMLPAVGSDGPTLTAGLDAVVAAATRLSTAAATSLAQMAATAVTQRPLPAKAVFPARAVALAHVPAFHLHPGTIATSAPIAIELGPADPRLAAMRDAFAGAVARFIRAGTSTPVPDAPALDLDAARTAILTNVDPKLTIAALAAARVPAVAGLVRLDPVAPVLAGPVFTDAAFLPLVEASHDAFVPGLDAIPIDSVTLVQTNPTFIAAYLAGLNSALGHELVWRGYPTDERGTYWHSFWGAGDEIGPLHLFTGPLAANVDAGAQPLLVLVIRGRLLRRYPDSDVYAVLAGTDQDVPELDDGTKIVRPLFRNFVAPDITLVGFPLTYDDVVGTAGRHGYWFVLAEHPGQPRFGLTDPDPAVTHPPLPSWDELSWADLGATAEPLYVPSAAPPIAPAGTTRIWGASAADMAAITYQPAVRVALRARDLLKASSG